MTSVKVSKKAADFSEKEPDCMMKVEMEANKSGNCLHIFISNLNQLFDDISTKEIPSIVKTLKECSENV